MMLALMAMKSVLVAHLLQPIPPATWARVFDAFIDSFTMTFNIRPLAGDVMHDILRSTLGPPPLAGAFV